MLCTGKDVLKTSSVNPFVAVQAKTKYISLSRVYQTRVNIKKLYFNGQTTALEVTGNMNLQPILISQQVCVSKVYGYTRAGKTTPNCRESSFKLGGSSFKSQKFQRTIG